MTSRFEKLREIVLAARELPEEERAAWLEYSCGEDAELRAEAESLLSHDHTEGLLNTGAAGGITPGDADEWQPGQQVGLYRIVEKIGEGGFGEVYAAEQLEPVNRMVALKVLKRGLDTQSVLARFDTERQALARMDHPYIAKIFDAGESDRGLPYFVMDLIRGIPITTYCDRHQLTTRERTLLVVDVCKAVQHAHQRGIIHRDLKPSNVLVRDHDEGPLPKVIDFGIAKAIEPQSADHTATVHGMVLGTPAYMSPEQAAGDGGVDTTTDVYSLGAILYELLTGAPPLEPDALQSVPPQGVSRVVAESDPKTPSERISQTPKEARTSLAALRQTEPSHWKGELRGELDWITMQALAKSPDRRYASASELARDLERHLAHEPIEAAPPSAAYRVGKFVRRHRLPVASAVVISVVLVVFAATMALQARRIAQERDRAERVAVFLADMFESVDLQTVGRSLWTDLRARIETGQRELGLAEEEVTEVLRNVDGAVAQVNTTDAAVRLLHDEILARAEATIDRELGDDPRTATRLRGTLGRTYREIGLFEEAETTLRATLSERESLFGREHEETIATRNELTGLLQQMGRNEEAGEFAAETLQLARRTLGDDDPVTLVALTNLGIGLRQRGEHEDAERVYREAFERHLRVHGPDHEQSISAEMHLGWLLHEIGQHEEGETLSRRAVEKGRRALGDDHSVTLAAANNLSTQLTQTGNLSEGEELARFALAGFQRTLGDEHPTTLITLVNLGALLDRQNKLDDAVEVYHASLAAFRAIVGDDHPNTIATMSNLGFALKTLGRYDEAEGFLQTTLDKSQELFGETHLQTLVAQGNFADLRVLQGRPRQAQVILEKAIRSAESALPPGHWNLGVLHRTYGVCLRDQKRFRQAEEALLHAHGVFVESLGEGHRRSRQTATNLAELYDVWKKPELATQWRERAASET